MARQEHYKRFKASKGKVYLLTGPDGNTVKVKNLPHFCIKNKLNYNAMIKVMVGRFKHYKQWKGFQIINKKPGVTQ